MCCSSSTRMCSSSSQVPASFTLRQCVIAALRRATTFGSPFMEPGFCHALTRAGTGFSSPRQLARDLEAAGAAVGASAGALRHLVDGARSRGDGGLHGPVGDGFADAQVHADV